MLRCGLATGVELDRPLLRTLRRELRRADALGLAARTLAHRDVSSRRLEERLRSRGVRPEVAEGAVATLTSAGVVDDARTVAARARSLADRGWGNAAIAARLEAEGFRESDVDAALAAVLPERERAQAVLAGVGDRRRAWKLLARRGFDGETVEDVLGLLDADR